MRALVLGGGADVFAEAEAAIALMGEPDAVAAINDMIAMWPGHIDYACTLHAEKLQGWMRSRKGNKRYQVWSHQPKPKLVHKHRRDAKGSSSLFAVFVMLDEGFDKIVCCGCPMTVQGGHIARKKDWSSANSYRKGWVDSKKLIENKVRSMSGWTMSQLGAPTKEWLES